jgi:ABC-type transporter Mla subunit MlaD
MDLKDIVAYVFIGLGVAGVAWFAWASRRGQNTQQTSPDDSHSK